MRWAHTVAQVRAAEADLMARVPEGTLMQRAAAGLAAAAADVLGQVYGARVRLLVGSGDNGGDGLFAGALLARRGALVEAVLLNPAKAHASGVEALRAAGGWFECGSAPPDLVIDAIVGIGATGPLRPDAVAALAACGDAPVIAVDVPSGVEVDTGEVSGPHVLAAVTVTFGTHKVAQLVDPAAAACGVVQLVDIGLAETIDPAASVGSLQAADVAALVPRPPSSGHKYSRGVVGLRTGSARYPGAAVLSVAGASCGLAGMVRYDGTAGAAVLAAHPEVVGAGRVQAWVVGSGGGDDADLAVAACLADRVPVVVDADGLACLPGLAGDRSALVLTPHAGELAALLGVERAAVEAAQLEHARLAAERLGAVVLLKGRRTLVAEPGGRVLVNTTGVPGLATAGAGDVLAGLIGALLATGVAPFEAAAAGAWLHGAAATLASADGPLVAGDVARALPRVLGGLGAGFPG